MRKIILAAILLMIFSKAKSQTLSPQAMHWAETTINHVVADGGRVVGCAGLTEEYDKTVHAQFIACLYVGDVSEYEAIVDNDAWISVLPLMDRTDGKGRYRVVGNRETGEVAVVLTSDTYVVYILGVPSNYEWKWVNV